ncbi:RICIN domain-containing protein [Saccharothrix xinjiangensis]|uniref:RICIN domain-containing protein n=1 Tax=Saccharothrix xinjiangensis TaxID=204798 RepID=A0ABV9Y6M6_9PSEU
MPSRVEFLRSCAAVVAAAVLAVVGTTATASAAPDQSTDQSDAGFRFRNDNSGLCLSIPGGSRTVGVQATQFDCEPDTAAKQFVVLDWYTDGYGNPVIGLSPYESFFGDRPLCLGVPGGSTTQGAAVAQFECSGNSDQMWAWDKASRLRNVKTNQCLSVYAGWTSPGVEIIQWGCGDGAAQKWRLY